MTATAKRQIGYASKNNSHIEKQNELFVQKIKSLYCYDDVKLNNVTNFLNFYQKIYTKIITDKQKALQKATLFCLIKKLRVCSAEIYPSENGFALYTTCLGRNIKSRPLTQYCLLCFFG